MNNLVKVIYKNGAEDKVWEGDYSVKADGSRFVVRHGPFLQPIFFGNRSEFFVSIESIDD